MEELIVNITNIYGAGGERWINQLPDSLAALTEYWNLSDVIPVPNMTFNYVAKALLHQQKPVVLKMGYDKKSLENEKRALLDLNRQGSIDLIDYNRQYNALLLQQAIPGMTLKSIYPIQMDYAMDCYVKTMFRLHHPHLPQRIKHPHISEWLSELDKPEASRIPIALLSRAIHLKNKLLSSLKTPILLHGDLHHDNILKHGNDWLAIDPKGVIGDREFEIAAFDFMYVSELANIKDIKSIMEKRIEVLAQKSNLDAQRIKDWIFVRLILMAAWLLEDNDDPTWAIKLADLLF